MSWVVLSELFPNRIRGKAMSLATCAMFASSYATTHVFPIIMDAFQDRFGHPGGTFLIFTGVCLAAAFFVWQTIPETKDKTLEEIAELWQTDTRTPGTLAVSPDARPIPPRAT